MRLKRGKAAIVATELATNLSRHATGGEIVIVGYSKNDTDGWVELVSVDRGPGIADVARCLEDGFSTGGGPGNGLGAVRRLSTEWDLYSSPETDSGPGGTVVFAGSPPTDPILSPDLLPGGSSPARSPRNVFWRRVAGGRTSR